MRTGAFKIAITYVVIGMLWITLSDQILEGWHSHAPEPLIFFLSSVKGVVYVLITGILLYHLITRYTKRLVESERQFRSYFQDNTNPMWILNRSTMLFKVVNDAAIAQYGYTREEFLELSALDLRPSDDINNFIDIMRGLEKGINQVGIVTHRKKDGTLIDVEITSYLTATGHNQDVMVMAKDVTKVRQLEKENAAYLSRLEDTLNSISDAFFTMDENCNILYVNTVFGKITGLDGAEVIGNNFFTLFPQGKGTDYEYNFNSALLNKQTVKFEAYSQSLQKWLRLVCYPTQTGLAVYFADITHDKEKDLQLTAALNRYDLVARATQDMLYELDLNNNKVVYAQRFGIFADIDWLGIENPVSAWIENIHPADRERVAKANLISLQNLQRDYTCEYRVLFNGDYRFVYDRAVITYNEDGQPVKMTGAIRDIHNLKTADAENKRLGEIVGKISNMVMITDEQKLCVWVNRAFEDFTGYKLEDVRGKIAGKILAGNNADFNITKQIVNKKDSHEPFALELPIFTKEGAKRWVFADFTPISNEDGKFTGYIAVYADISSLKENELSLEQQNKVLRDIAWTSSHELRKPLATMLGLMELIRCSNDEEEKQQCLNYMDIAAAELDDMIRKFNSHIVSPN